MAALDFPASPTVGQLYPAPPVTGVPVYKWDGEKWTTLGGALGSTGASDAIPQADTGTGAAGSSTLWSRGDHAHPIPPTDLTRAPIASPTFTGDPKAPTPAAGDNDTSLATTAFVSGAISTAVGGIPGAPSAVVRYDIAQSLTPPQLIQARQNIYAAPFDAMAYSGLQINGSMEVSQDTLVANPITISSSGRYICDTWVMESFGTQVMQAYTGGGGLPGFPLALISKPTTANASPAATDRVTFSTRIEGYRISRLAWGSGAAPQPITIGFWVFAVRGGNYSGAVTNSPRTRAYPFSFAVTAGVWQYITVTVPGCTDGTWATTNALGMEIFFTAMAGSTNQAPAGAWATGVYYAATGTINGVAATSDQFLIGGVIVVPGNEAPSAARSTSVMRPFDQELLTCQRYYEKSYNYSVPPATATPIGMAGMTVVASVTGINVPVSLKVRKRAAPTINFWSGTGVPNQFSNTAAGDQSFASIVTINTPGEGSFGGGSTVTSSSGVYFHWAADARM